MRARMREGWGDPDRALPGGCPKTVESFFITLSKKAFADGLAFHWVIPGFVAQGGDPKEDGTGGPGYTQRAEFNLRRHVRGTMAMARSQHRRPGVSSTGRRRTSMGSTASSPRS